MTQLQTKSSPHWQVLIQGQKDRGWNSGDTYRNIQGYQQSLWNCRKSKEERKPETAVVLSL